jgi:integrase
MAKKILLVPLVKKFIRDTANGKRRMANGQRIKHRSVVNYFYALKHLVAFEQFKGEPLYVTINIRSNRKQMLRETDYWKKFYREFSDYLFQQKNCHDNFVGSIFKVLKCCFRYLKYEKYIPVPECCEHFYVRKEEPRIIALLPEQFCFLVLNKDFEESLSLRQRRFKDMFVFGCTAALRHSDLINLEVRSIEYRFGNYFLVFKTTKTNTSVCVKLPSFAVDIFQKSSKRKKPHQKLFGYLSLTNFNNNLQKMAEKAGWTERIGKYKSKNGRTYEIKTATKNMYRFCDLLGSHTMRRTGITMLLMLGMPEYLVRKISGHAAHSKEFFRYVHVAESYITDEIDKAHQKLLSLYHQ